MNTIVIRSRKNWIDTVRQDLEETGMCGEEAQERCDYGVDVYSQLYHSHSWRVTDAHHALCSSVHKQARKLGSSIGTIAEFSGALTRPFLPWEGLHPLLTPHSPVAFVASCLGKNFFLAMALY